MEERIFSLKALRDTVTCSCGNLSERIVSCRLIGQVWAEGRRFENVDDGKRNFKSWKEVEKHCKKNGLALDAWPKKKLKEMQESRHDRKGSTRLAKPKFNATIAEKAAYDAIRSTQRTR